MSTHIDFGAVYPIRGWLDLRGRVVNSANTSRHIVGLGGVRHGLVHRELAACSETKVTNLDVVDSISADANEHIFWFEITMYDAQTVYVSKTFKDLSEKSPDLSGVLV